MDFYERIEKLRDEKKISQKDLEIALEFSNGSISKWKKSMPTPERLKKVADYFDVTVEYLLTGEEKEAPALSAEAMELIKMYENASPDRRRLARIALGSPEQEP